MLLNLVSIHYISRQFSHRLFLNLIIRNYNISARHRTLLFTRFLLNFISCILWCQTTTLYLRPNFNITLRLLRNVKKRSPIFLLWHKRKMIVLLSHLVTLALFWHFLILQRKHIQILLNFLLIKWNQFITVAFAIGSWLSWQLRYLFLYYFQMLWYLLYVWFYRLYFVRKLIFQFLRRFYRW